MRRDVVNLYYLFSRLGMELSNYDAVERKDITYHDLRHSFKEEVIIPTVALSNVFDFFMQDNAEKVLKLADGTKCQVVSYKEMHICELEDDIKRLYDTDAWSFVKRWYSFDRLMSNMMFIKMNLKKI